MLSDVIQGQTVDLITPYPTSQIKRAFGWMHCYKSITQTDEFPKTFEEFQPYMERYLQVCTSFGIIDKNQLTNRRHEAPLVGILIFEPGGPHNGYWHVATSRRAWGTGLVDEAARLAFQYAFDHYPQLTRLSASIAERNYPARGLTKRLGFKCEGVLEDIMVLDGQPLSMVHYGLTRKNWQAKNSTLEATACPS